MCVCVWLGCTASAGRPLLFIDRNKGQSDEKKESFDLRKEHPRKCNSTKRTTVVAVYHQTVFRLLPLPCPCNFQFRLYAEEITNEQNVDVLQKFQRNFCEACMRT